MSDYLDLAAAIVGGCCAHCDDLVDERLALLDEAGMLVSPERDAAVAAKAWSEGFRAGRQADHNSMWWPPNPHRIEREAGESDADT